LTEQVEKELAKLSTSGKDKDTTSSCLCVIQNETCWSLRDQQDTLPIDIVDDGNPWTINDPIQFRFGETHSSFGVIEQY
jgi:hypothetical protein